MRVFLNVNIVISDYRCISLCIVNKLTKCFILFCLQVNATDPDCGVNGQIHYSLEGQASNFQVNQLTGQICIIQNLDHEQFELYEFSIVATDSGKFIGQISLRWTIINN